MIQMKYKQLISASLVSMLLTGVSALADNHKVKLAPLSDSDFIDDGAPHEGKVVLGKFLMFDKILSGNMNISCATCHHPMTNTGDGLSLPIGEGGNGLGMTRDTGSSADAVVERVPRNSPHVWNEGAREFTAMFLDGRVELDDAYPSGCKTPAGNNLPDNLENILACQAMFPVTSATEMAGQGDENPIAVLAELGNLTGVWELLAERLRAPENGYVELFIDAFEDIDDASDITYGHAANAISAYERVFWRADNSPFDRYLRGDKKAMSRNAIEGMAAIARRPECTGLYRDERYTPCQGDCSVYRTARWHGVQPRRYRSNH